MNTTTTYRAIDPKTGLVIRPATDAEIAEWKRTTYLDRDVLVGEVLISEHNGPGLPPWTSGDN